MSKVGAAVVVVGVVLVGAGCVGDTDAPTQVGAHTATLNAHGKANNGPAYSCFQYWKTGNFSSRLKTRTRNWPAGARGSFSERPQPLSEETAYSYRDCGNDRGKAPICASIKEFKTHRAVSTVVVDSSDTARFNSRVDCGFTDRASIKVGDLDDFVDASYWLGVAMIVGGPGDGLLAGVNFGAPGLGDTLIGGSGHDDLRAGGGDDTIRAGSTNPLNPDTDKLIACGDGEDTVYADRSDPISVGQKGCEHVFKP